MFAINITAPAGSPPKMGQYEGIFRLAKVSSYINSSDMFEAVHRSKL